MTCDGDRDNGEERAGSEDSDVEGEVGEVLRGGYGVRIDALDPSTLFDEPGNNWSDIDLELGEMNENGLYK